MSEMVSVRTAPDSREIRRRSETPRKGHRLLYSCCNWAAHCRISASAGDSVCRRGAIVRVWLSYPCWPWAPCHFSGWCGSVVAWSRPGRVAKRADVRLAPVLKGGSGHKMSRHELHHASAVPVLYLSPDLFESHSWGLTMSSASFCSDVCSGRELRGPKSEGCCPTAAS